MNSSIHLIKDSNGLAVIGEPSDIKTFLSKNNLDQFPSKDIALEKLGRTAHLGSLLLETGSCIAAGSGRWVKITEKSASQIEKFGLMKSKETGLSLGVVQADNGKIKGIVEFAKGPGQIFSNPAVLSGAAGIMAQIAIQKQIEDVINYLESLDNKLNEIARNQKNSILSDIDGVQLILKEAWTIHEKTGQVSQTNWSKIQGSSFIIARSQAYALRQLEGISENIHSADSAADIAEITQKGNQQVRTYIEILARCIQLQNILECLELDRVLNESPEEINRYRIGLNEARESRQESIENCSSHLLREISEAVNKANSKVLFNPFKSPAAVHASKEISLQIHNFRNYIGIQSSYEEFYSREWIDAASDAKEKIISSTAKGIENAYKYGIETSEKMSQIIPSLPQIAQEPKHFQSPTSLGSKIKSMANEAATNTFSYFKDPRGKPTNRQDRIKASQDIEEPFNPITEPSNINETEEHF